MCRPWTVSCSQRPPFSLPGWPPTRVYPRASGEPPSRSRTRPGSTVYPRASGGTAPIPSSPSHGGGLSPRERGNRDADDGAAEVVRSIPARAGEPGAASGVAKTGQVYPRASGGTGRGIGRSEDGSGLSPRERGNQPFLAPALGDVRSIPARAGEPPYAVHRPRHGEGLSPRERGNLPYRCRLLPRILVYPRASGGNPRGRPLLHGVAAVYPRASGGTMARHGSLVPSEGLSPRERGNQVANVTPRVYLRSIPARAGEPPRKAMPRAQAQVYPRASGGTISANLTAP